jgi:adenylate cyclase
MRPLARPFPARTVPSALAADSSARTTLVPIVGAHAAHVWFGPLTLHRGSKPFMAVAVAGARPSAGITIAEINLKLIWDVISAIHIGKTGRAFVLDGVGRLVAHPDISLVLRDADNAAIAPLGGERQKLWGFMRL